MRHTTLGPYVNEENVTADAIELTPGQIEALAAVTQPAGDHHPEAQMRQLER